MAASWQPQVFLVGAGPGDPGLLTRRGESVLRRADVVFYDFLTNPMLLDLVPAESRRINVGKRGGRPSPTQESIHEQMIAEAHAGKTVVRLKGGDCFVFGRGGEEAIALLAAGIRYEVVPGVTSAIAVPALAGLATTHRGVSSSLHIVTGHEDPRAPHCSVPWKVLAQSGGTLIVMMGSARIREIAAVLLEHGMAGPTPAATIRRGSYPVQESERTTLGELTQWPGPSERTTPTLFVIGEVVAMDEALNWFERRPLFGRRLVLTRPAESGSVIADVLAEAGAQVESIPAIRFKSVAGASGADFGGKMRALGEAGGWLLLPSPAAIRRFFAALNESTFDARLLAGTRVAVIGRRSAEDLAAHGIKADFVPEGASARVLGESLPLRETPEPVLIAGAVAGRAELPEALSARGAAAEQLALYETVPDEDGLARLADRWDVEDPPELVVFSPSAVRALLGSEPLGGAERLGRARWHAIGETTARAIREAGLEPAGVARRPTAEALIEALGGGGE